MSFSEMIDHKIIDIFKIKELELKALEKGMLSNSQRYTCSKHLDYYYEQRFKLKCYLEKKGYPFNNEKNCIGTFNENTKEVIKQWKLCDGQCLSISIDFEKGGFYISDISSFELNF